MNLLIRGAPQDLKSTQKCHYWKTRLVSHWNIPSIAFTLNINMRGTNHIPMDLGGFVKVLVAAQVGCRINVLMAHTPLGSLNLMTFLKTAVSRHVTPVWCVR